MRLKAVASIVVSVVFALAVPNLGISQSESGQSHAAVLIPTTTMERPEDVGLRAHTNHLILFEGKPGGVLLQVRVRNRCARCTSCHRPVAMA